MAHSGKLPGLYLRLRKRQVSSDLHSEADSCGHGLCAWLKIYRSGRERDELMTTAASETAAEKIRDPNQRDRLRTISELAREFNITARTIRFYEDKGMLKPVRKGQRRLYALRERVRLKLILRGRRLGFSLSEIREIIDLYDAEPGEAGQLEHLLNKIAERRGELKQKRADIEVILSELDGIEVRCHARLGELEC